MDTPTADPDIVLEEQRSGYWRYRHLVTGERWEMFGYCDMRGDCLIGMTWNGVTIRDHEHLREVAGGKRWMSNLDVPVRPEFHGCCPITGRYL